MKSCINNLIKTKSLKLHFRKQIYTLENKLISQKTNLHFTKTIYTLENYFEFRKNNLEKPNQTHT